MRRDDNVLYSLPLSRSRGCGPLVLYYSAVPPLFLPKIGLEIVLLHTPPVCLSRYF